MAAQHAALVGNSFCNEGDALRLLLQEATRFVLQSQHVINPINGVTYYVARVSGMGGLMSCELCDSAFYNLVERDFILVPAVQHRYRIKCWTRYRDDICRFQLRLALPSFSRCGQNSPRERLESQS